MSSVIIGLVLQKITKLFSRVIVPFYIPIATDEWASVSASSAVLDVITIFYFNHPHRCHNIFFLIFTFP